MHCCSQFPCSHVLIWQVRKNPTEFLPQERVSEPQYIFRKLCQLLCLISEAIKLKLVLAPMDNTKIYLETSVCLIAKIEYTVFIKEIKIESPCVRTSDLRSCVVLMYMYVMTSLWRCNIGRPILHQSRSPFTLLSLASN